MKKRLSMLLICLLCIPLLTSALAEGDLELSMYALGPETLEGAPAPDDMPGVELDLDLTGTELESAEPKPNIAFSEPNAGDIPVDAEHFPDDSFRSFADEDPFTPIDGPAPY